MQHITEISHNQIAIAFLESNISSDNPNVFCGSYYKKTDSCDVFLGY